MRPDMKNLLVEGGHAFKEWPTKRPKGWARKCRFRHAEDRDEENYVAPKFRPQFSENLPPLRRYLERQVGRPWDKVYSEIRAHVNADSAVQYHILQHIYDRLEVRVWRGDDGGLWYLDRWGGVKRIEDRWGPHLYVCPDTGLLRRVKRRRRTEADQAVDHLPASGSDHEYRQLSDQWYEVWWDTTSQDGKPVRFIARKRQLSYKELRKLGLRD